MSSRALKDSELRKCLRVSEWGLEALWSCVCMCVRKSSANLIVNVREKRKKGTDARELKWYRGDSSSSRSSIRHQCSSQLCANSLNIPEEDWLKKPTPYRSKNRSGHTELMIAREGGQKRNVFLELVSLFVSSLVYLSSSNSPMHIESSTQYGWLGQCVCVCV